MQTYLFISGDMIVTIESALPKREAMECAVGDLIDLMDEEDGRVARKFKETSPVLSDYFKL